jgi:hypothetical protein
MLGKKEGLFTKEEVKILWKVASKEIPVPAIVKPLVNLVVPNLLDGLDNKVGDRIPEPWQTYCEKLITMVTRALEDKVVTQEEVDEVMAFAAKVANEKIDLPLIDDDVEVSIFLETFRMAGVLLYDAFKKKSKK